VVESQTDIPKILERYRKFVEQHIGTPASDEALKDLQVWEQRLEKGMVKAGDKWVTREEQAQLQARAAERATAARLMLVEGRFKEATAEIDSALAEDPDNAAAHYLRGLAAFRQQQVVNARKAFEASAQLRPSHGPTLNNIAVLMWGSKQYPGAINYYGQAMNAAPGTRAILDNVAEALHELPKAQRDNPATKKVVLQFNAQDMTLQGKMKTRGLLRWGSTWVSEKDLKRLEGEEERIEDRLVKLEDEFEQVQDRLEQIARDIADTQRSLRRIEASSYGRDANGRPIKLSYPPLYYDLKRDLEHLYNEEDGEKEKKLRLRAQAKRVQQDISIPRYTGVQQIIGVEGTPDLPPLTAEDDSPPPPATRPATATAPAQEPEAGAGAE
jgi:tetratricopeptide (TPR) repeat protein